MFNVGDTVRVKEKFWGFGEDGVLGINPSMYQYEGEVFTVFDVRIRSDGRRRYRLTDHKYIIVETESLKMNMNGIESWTWCDKWLEEVFTLNLKDVDESEFSELFL